MTSRFLALHTISCISLIAVNTLQMFHDVMLSQSLPEEMCKLEVLLRLELSHNKLKTLPGAMPPALQHLSLNNNLIAEMPACVAGLSALQTLDMRGWKFNTFLGIFWVILVNFQTAYTKPMCKQLSLWEGLPEYRSKEKLMS